MHTHKFCYRYDVARKKYADAVGEYVKTKEIETKLRWTVESLMTIVAPLKGKEGPSTQADEGLDGVLNQLDIITKRVKFGVEELTKYHKKNDSPTDKDTKERDLGELLEKEVTENAKNVRVEVKASE